MKKWMEQFRVEDWVVVWVSIPLLALAAIVPAGLPKVPATLLGGAAWSNIAYLFAVVLAVLLGTVAVAARRVSSVAPPAQGPAAVARGGFRRLPAGADRGQDSRRLLLRLRVGFLLGALRSGDPQRVAGPGVDETRDSGRILHQDRRRMSRCHDPFQRRDEVGRLRSGAGLSGGRRRVVLRLLGVAPHEG